MGNATPVVVYVLFFVVTFVVMYRPIMAWAEEDLDGIRGFDQMIVLCLLTLISLLWPAVAVIAVLKITAEFVDRWLFR